MLVAILEPLLDLCDLRDPILKSLQTSLFGSRFRLAMLSANPESQAQHKRLKNDRFAEKGYLYLRLQLSDLRLVRAQFLLQVRG